MNDNAPYKNNYDSCPLTFALTLIGGKWRLPVIRSIHKNKTMRYNELRRDIQGITSMMLSQSLKELETYGIVERKQFEEIPPRVEYSLTDNGKSLIPALKALADWGDKMRKLKA
jgi:DNA-binding HxlR family transcriptional regulator